MGYEATHDLVARKVVAVPLTMGVSRHDIWHPNIIVVNQCISSQKILITIAEYFVIREIFEIPNDALEQPKLNILTWLKVLKSSTKFGDFKNFGRDIRNFDGARRIFYEVIWHIFSVLSKI